MRDGQLVAVIKILVRLFARLATVSVRIIQPENRSGRFVWKRGNVFHIIFTIAAVDEVIDTTQFSSFLYIRQEIESEYY